jgi:predicted transcriptional regulator
MSKENLSDPITLRIPIDVLTEIEEIAETTERTRSWVIVRALKAYLQSEGANILAFRKGRQEIADGDFEDFDDVLADMERIASEKVA